MSTKLEEMPKGKIKFEHGLGLQAHPTQPWSKSEGMLKSNTRRPFKRGLLKLLVSNAPHLVSRMLSTP